MRIEDETASVSVSLPTASRRSHTRIKFYEKPKRVSPTIKYRYPSAFPRGKGDHEVVDEGNLYIKDKWDNLKALILFVSNQNGKDVTFK